VRDSKAKGSAHRYRPVGTGGHSGVTGARVARPLAFRNGRYATKPLKLQQPKSHRRTMARLDMGSNFVAPALERRGLLWCAYVSLLLKPKPSVRRQKQNRHLDPEAVKIRLILLQLKSHRRTMARLDIGSNFVAPALGRRGLLWCAYNFLCLCLFYSAQKGPPAEKRVHTQLPIALELSIIIHSHTSAPGWFYTVIGHGVTSPIQNYSKKKLTFFGRRFKGPYFAWIENKPRQSRRTTGMVLAIS
jgi:hypothetical protein